MPSSPAGRRSDTHTPAQRVERIGLPSPPGLQQPPAQLKGFDKVTLAAGQSTRVSFTLGPRALSYWDTAAGGWRVAPGCYRVMVGSSSRELPLRGVFGQGGARCTASPRAAG